MFLHAETASADPDAGMSAVMLCDTMMKNYPGLTPKAILEDMTLSQITVMQYV